MKNVKLPGAEGYNTQMQIHTSTQKHGISLAREFQKHRSDTSHRNGVIDQIRYIKWVSQRKWTEHAYHVQDRNNVTKKSVEISCAITYFPAFPFCGPHIKPHGVRGLRKHYHL